MTDGPVETDRTVAALGPEAYRAMYLHSPDGVLFTVPSGRILAANPAACQIFGRTETEICALGRQGLADPTDGRWPALLDERERAGQVRGVARMIRGDGTIIEVEMSARVFSESAGEPRTCTIVRDVTERVRMEREIAQLNARLHELALTDELTGLCNRRGFVAAGSQLLALADRQQCTTVLLFLDLDNMKELNDTRGHGAGDAALKAVAQALTDVLRRADTSARIGGDEFAALAFGVDAAGHEAIERRIRDQLDAPATVAAVGRQAEVSMGWATRSPGQSTTVEDLLAAADHAMYRAKASKAKQPGRPRPAGED